MNCITCNNSLINAIYKCTASDYRLEDVDGNLIFIKSTHNFDPSYEEVNTSVNCVYCQTCNEIVQYPTTYDNVNYEFKNGDLTMRDYYDYLNKNIIHQFTNITCRNCNNTLQRGKFTNTVMSQTTDNLLNYSYPNDFTNTIHIANETTGTHVKDIDIKYPEIDPIPETDIGKKIIYCPNCNFFIMNNLKEIDKTN
jgi:hypothetical protein